LEEEFYWTQTHGGQLLSGPKLINSCSVYQEEEDTDRSSSRGMEKNT